MQIFPAYGDLQGPYFVDNQIEKEVEYLTETGSYGSTFNSKCREGTDAKDQQWIENDIVETQPTISPAIVTFILPIPWKIFS